MIIAECTAGQRVRDRVTGRLGTVMRVLRHLRLVRVQWDIQGYDHSWTCIEPDELQVAEVEE